MADENLITSVEPATPFPMAYKMVEVSGIVYLLSKRKYSIAL
ncbi:hypothetical protein [Sharpea azabuensis]|nr:hypothetical protein [Sharpea azabuensis]